VTAPTFEVARAAITDSGLEVFRVKDETIQLAERVRSHLMDASVSVSFDKQARIQFIVRAQTSDFPGSGPDEMFNRVRHAVVNRAQARGFAESDRRCRQIYDPVDDSRVLDVWYELTFSKEAGELVQLMDDLRFALGVKKCIS
jgi:hypothetical protein